MIGKKQTSSWKILSTFIHLNLHKTRSICSSQTCYLVSIQGTFLSIIKIFRNEVGWRPPSTWAGAKWSWNWWNNSFSIKTNWKYAQGSLIIRKIFLYLYIFVYLVSKLWPEKWSPKKANFNSKCFLWALNVKNCYLLCEPCTTLLLTLNRHVKCVSLLCFNLLG